jgi:hypothetical protein
MVVGCEHGEEEELVGDVMLWFYTCSPDALVLQHALVLHVGFTCSPNALVLHMFPRCFGVTTKVPACPLLQSPSAF